MSAPLLSLVPAVASAMGLPIQQSASQFAAETAAVLTSVNSAVVDIARVAYVTCLLVGVLLYFTHVGREYVITAVTAPSG